MSDHSLDETTSIPDVVFSPSAAGGGGGDARSASGARVSTSASYHNESNIYQMDGVNVAPHGHNHSGANRSHTRHGPEEPVGRR